MKIKKIKILKNKVTITLDNKEKIELDKDIYPNFYLYEGKEISKKEINKIKEENDSIALLRYALRIRSKKIYSEYALREKLYGKGAAKKTVDQIINKMKSLDLVDDNAFILDYVSYYNSMNYGENKIKELLRNKGIFSEKIDKINFPVSIERNKARNIFPKLEKKYEKYNDSQKKSHIYNTYISMGFSNEIANEFASKVTPSKNEDEYKKCVSDYNKAKLRLSRKYKGKELKGKIISSLLIKGYKMNDIMKLIERDF